MLVTGLSLHEFASITAEISGRTYGGNVIVNSDAHELSAERFRARLRTASSRGPGARRAARSGHRTVATCWHAYRDVLQAVFERHPNAVVRTMLAAYKGREGFETLYPATASVNIGSQINPVTMPQLCECADNGPGEVNQSDIVDRIDRAVDEWTRTSDAFRHRPTSAPYPV